MPDSLERFRDLFELDPHSLALRPAPELEAGAVLPGAAVMRKPQGIERLRLAFAPALSAFGGICAELNQAGLSGCKLSANWARRSLRGDGVAPKQISIWPGVGCPRGVMGLSRFQISLGRCGRKMQSAWERAAGMAERSADRGGRAEARRSHPCDRQQAACRHISDPRGLRTCR